MVNGSNISNTRDSVSLGYPNEILRRGVCIPRRGVWIADETLPQVFDISSQLKQKLRSTQRRRIV